MAQGAPKKTGSKPAAAGRANKPQPPKTKKGARVVKSKKGSAADKLQRKLAAGITNKTERMLGERAGHLELIGPGKKARGQNKDAAVKGGSRKDIVMITLLNGTSIHETKYVSEKSGVGVAALNISVALSSHLDSRKTCFSPGATVRREINFSIALFFSQHLKARYLGVSSELDYEKLVSSNGM
ncbi:hypothetical protein CIB48_g12020 [Xylaria polymorpha]|nr:hypothetical protein CIB48_g12020 [Xylaria polymorpha]